MSDAKSKATTLIQENKVMVFSKSHCPYSAKVKSLFKGLNVPFTVYELDVESDGGAIQAYLKDFTNQGTVPNVFIGTKHVGGSDATHAARDNGNLKKLLNDAGITVALL